MWWCGGGCVGRAPSPANGPFQTPLSPLLAPPYLRGRGRPRHMVNLTPKGKGHPDFSAWPLFMPATTGVRPERSRRAPTHFRAQYYRPRGLTSGFGRGWFWLRRQIHLGIAARLCQMNRLHHQPNMGAKAWPLLLAENNNRNFPVRQVLLVADVFVSRQQQSKPAASAAVSSSPFLSVSQPS